MIYVAKERKHGKYLANISIDIKSVETEADEKQEVDHCACHDEPEDTITIGEMLVEHGYAEVIPGSSLEIHLNSSEDGEEDEDDDDEKEEEEEDIDEKEVGDGSENTFCHCNEQKVEEK